MQPILTYDSNNMPQALFYGASSIILHKEGKFTQVGGTDFIVNPADPAISGGGGLDKEIQDEGGNSVRKAVSKIGTKKLNERCPFGQARITKAGNLQHVAVIHAVGPTC